MLSLFDRTNHVRDEFEKYNYQAYSLDIEPGYTNSPVDFNMSIMDFDYKSFDNKYFDFIFIALPCTAYSRASGGFHFKNQKPKTAIAISSINILIKVWQITQYFKCDFAIENPTGGLNKNLIFKSFFDLPITRIHMQALGYTTPKQTDIFTSFNLLWLSNPVHRVNGRYNKKKFHNLSYKQRITYPTEFTSQLVFNIVNQIS